MQAKLTVGSASDRAEREADAVATQVVAALRRQLKTPAATSLTVAGEATGRIRRASHEAPSMPAPIVGRIRRRATVGAAGGDLDDETAAGVQREIGHGRPLDASGRATMESAFGVDFSGVRVHEGRRSAELNRSMAATAFTVGTDIFFRDGAPDAQSASGQGLLAHELTHVVQQGGAPARRRIDPRAQPGAERNSEPGTPVSGNATDARPPAGKVRRRTGDAESKFLRPGSSNPKVDGTDLAVIQAEQQEAAREEMQEQREANKGKAAKTKAARDAIKIKGPDANTNFRGSGLGLVPRAGYAVKAVVTTLPDIAVKRVTPAGANATAAIDADDYGICDTEAITDPDMRITAVRDGDEWHAEAVKIVGPYSKIVQLPAGVTEVTGPGGGGGGATTVGNSTEQVTNLLATFGPPWYMASAVDGHESVHETRLLPALREVAPEFQQEFAKLTVPYQSAKDAQNAPVGGPTKYGDKAAALAAIKALPAYAALVTSLRDTWDAKYVEYIGSDHQGKAQKGEEKATRPMIGRINTFRKKNSTKAVPVKAIPVKYTWTPY